MPKDFKFKPAADLDLTLPARVRSIHRERGVFSMIYSLIWWTTIGLFMRLYCRFEIIGRDNLPKDLPFVMIGNHSSHADVVSLMLALPLATRDRVFPLAAEDHFFRKTWTAFFSAFVINALPLTRTGGGVQAMEQLRQRLLAGGSGFIIFPEGSRSRTGKMSEFKSGVGILVAGTEIPVVPCYIQGGFEAFPANAIIPIPHKVKLHIGKPLTFAKISNDKNGCELIAGKLEKAVRNLV